MIIETIGQFVVLPVLAITLILAFVRLVKGPSTPDRVVALDLMGTIGIALIAAYALINKEYNFLDVAIVVGLIGFLGTVAFAYYIERRT